MDLGQDPGYGPGQAFSNNPTRSVVKSIPLTSNSSLPFFRQSPRKLVFRPKVPSPIKGSPTVNLPNLVRDGRSPLATRRSAQCRQEEE